MKITAYSVAALLLLSISARAEEPIHLHFADRPPYAIANSDGEPTGVVISPAEKAFKQANVPFVWTKTQVNRSFSIIKENRGLDCAPGFEKTLERSQFAKFTDPLYIGQPVVALTSLKVKEKEGVTFKHLLSKYVILFKENYTIGEKITAMIKQSPKSYLTTIDSIQMVQMISQNAADFMLISNEEVAYFFRHGVLDRKTVRVFMLPDVKVRFQRRIMCSKQVDDRTIEKLNHAIQSMKVHPSHFDDSFVEN